MTSTDDPQPLKPDQNAANPIASSAGADLTSLKSSSTNDLSDRVALVTGGGTGIGLMIARGFLANGAKVYITGRREEVLKRTAEQNKGLIPLQMDVTDKESIAHAVSVLEKQDGKLDILVNNAGIGGPWSGYPPADKSSPEHSDTRLGLGPFLFKHQSWEDWQHCFATNTIAPFFTTTGFSGLLEKGAQVRKGPSGNSATSCVINISSTAGSVHSSYNLMSYGPTKAGLEHLTGTMAREFAIHKVPIRVNCIAPGPFPSQRQSQEELDRQIREGGLLAKTVRPPNDRSGREEELASAAVWLSSDGGAYTNGITMRIDGGLGLVS